MIKDLNDRSREIFRHIIDAYVETGAPIGSRTLADRLSEQLSPASIRNVMADLEHAGLLFSPHTSAGRLPTEMGLRFFVDGLLELGNLTEDERADIRARCAADGQSVEEALGRATDALAGLSHCTGLVVAPKIEAPLRQVEFVNLSPGKALVILVAADGSVENRVIQIPEDLPPFALTQASNFLSTRLSGKTLMETRQSILDELDSRQLELDDLTARVIETGLATWSDGDGRGTLIVRGQHKLLDDVKATDDLERIRELFEILETSNELVRVLELTEGAEGVRIYIGSENHLFNMSGSSLIVAPYSDGSNNIVGAIGVIGPTRLNYARIIPMVDYTAKLIGRLVG
jgi:heat-inducible transcriptional repressor